MRHRVERRADAVPTPCSRSRRPTSGVARSGSRRRVRCPADAMRRRPRRADGRSERQPRDPAPTPAPAATPHPLPLCPAVPSGNPVDLLAFLFNPIFQTMFLLLAVFYTFIGDVGIAIILLTLLIKTVLIPLFRAQIVSQRRMQMIQPEVRAIQQQVQGQPRQDQRRDDEALPGARRQPGSGCLPAFLQLFLLLPIYSVISQGLAAPDISSAMQFLGSPVNIMTCQAPGTLQPCIDPTISWLFNLDAHVPEVLFRMPIRSISASAAWRSSRPPCSSSRRG